MAAAVLLAALPSLHASDPPRVARVSAGKAGLDGSLGAQALQVLCAVAGLQVRPAARVVEPYERVDAVAGTLLPRPSEVPLTGC